VDILSGGLFGLGAMFPHKYTGALMNGQGLAGLGVALVAVFTLLGNVDAGTRFCNDDSPTACDKYELNFSALAYFLLATVVLVSCIFAYWKLEVLPITR
jgi:hypothetical protein